MLGSGLRPPPVKLEHAAHPKPSQVTGPRRACTAAGRHANTVLAAAGRSSKQHRQTLTSAAATETRATTGWMQKLNPFGQKQAVEPLVPTVTRAELQNLLQTSELPVVVVFSATWCGPCKVMMQRLENVARELGPRAVKVVKIDTEESEGGSDLATELGIYKLPTMIFCGRQEGKPAVQVQGVVKDGVLLDLVVNKCQLLGNDMQNMLKW